ncbi:MAG: hypothetical protein GTO13_12705 [Proteobacteria bacterium]|nr:hypothetical protein [Pseudomonadota bacterium]
MVSRLARHEKREGKTARRKKTLVPADFLDFPDMHDAIVVARQSKSDLRVLVVMDLSITGAVANMVVELF